MARQAHRTAPARPAAHFPATPLRVNTVPPGSSTGAQPSLSNPFGAPLNVPSGQSAPGQPPPPPPRLVQMQGAAVTSPSPTPGTKSKKTSPAEKPRTGDETRGSARPALVPAAGHYRDTGKAAARPKVPDRVLSARSGPPIGELTPADRVSTVSHLAGTIDYNAKHASVHAETANKQARKLKGPLAPTILHNTAHAQKHMDDVTEHVGKLNDQLAKLPGVAGATEELAEQTPSSAPGPSKKTKKKA